MPSATTAPAVKPAKKALPKPDSDFYQHIDVLTADEKAIVKKVRTYMESRSSPSSTSIGPRMRFNSSYCLPSKN